MPHVECRLLPIRSRDFSAITSTVRFERLVRDGTPARFFTYPSGENPHRWPTPALTPALKRLALGPRPTRARSLASRAWTRATRHRPEGSPATREWFRKFNCGAPLHVSNLKDTRNLDGLAGGGDSVEFSAKYNINQCIIQFNVILSPILSPIAPLVARREIIH